MGFAPGISQFNDNYIKKIWKGSLTWPLKEAPGVVCSALVVTVCSSLGTCAKAFKLPEDASVCKCGGVGGISSMSWIQADAVLDKLVFVGDLGVE